MKTARRENRTSNGTKATVERIIKELRSDPVTADLPSCMRGDQLFAIWKARKTSRQSGRR